MEIYGFKNSALVINPAVAIEVFSRSIELTVGWLRWYCVISFKHKHYGRK